MSGGVDETFLDPAKAASGATQLTHAGENLSNAVSRLAGTIERLNQEQAPPWGTDEAGQKFFEEYLKAGDKSPANLVLDGTREVAEQVRQLGPDVRAAVLGTVETDDLVAKWFGKDGK